MAGDINKSGAAAMERAVAELGRSRRQVYALAVLLAPAQTSLDMSLALTCNLHLSMQFYFMTTSNHWQEIVQIHKA